MRRALKRAVCSSAPCAKWLHRLQAPDANHITRPFADERTARLGTLTHPPAPPLARISGKRLHPLRE
ncbi:MAG: hypothetical protein FWD90_14235 [Defluviitaleaceae bacterium]|nr:hypothetical protein [Defluviitaleaceae bacterium]